MALADILAAIVAEADRKIAEARSAHQKSVTKLREESERRLSTAKQELCVSKEQRKKQMLEKAKTHVTMLGNTAQLTTKRELLDELYREVLSLLKQTDDSAIEPLLAACMKQLPGEGTLHPAEKHERLIQKLAPKDCEVGKPIKAGGGFRFESSTQEMDFTLEYLVQSALRPATELESASILFS